MKMVKRTILNIINLIYKRRLRKKKVFLLSKVKINTKTLLEGNNKIYQNSTIINASVGIGTYIGWNSKLNNCKIGRFCSIAPYVEVIYGRHPVKKFISTHPAFFSLQKQAGFTFTNEQLYLENKLVDNKYSAVIGNDVWIGYGATIVEGIKIGDGAIIGAKSVVTKDVEPYSINVGIPAKKIGYRFEEHQRQLLASLEWWNKDFEWIKENKKYFEDVEAFYERFNNLQD
ncbi:antibiotic acetyltransferase [Bacillus sp. Y1]|nr:CatB-related O-acetyltransferase [Bacillus sp. Y1]AYA78085.1 antibiotic acetyltransferase [Bacillus sp. Y1]